MSWLDQLTELDYSSIGHAMVAVTEVVADMSHANPEHAEVHWDVNPDIIANVSLWELLYAGRHDEIADLAQRLTRDIWEKRVALEEAR